MEKEMEVEVRESDRERVSVHQEEEMAYRRPEVVQSQMDRTFWPKPQILFASLKVFDA